jgi:hypothetical protein
MDNTELLVLKGLPSQTAVQLKDCNETMIRQTIDSIDWSEFHRVILTRSTGEVFEVGGSTSGDGFAAVWVKDGEMMVAGKPPGSITQMRDLMLSWFFSDERFKRWFLSTEHDGKVELAEDDPEFLRWKEELLVKKSEEMKRYVRSFIIKIAVIIVALVVIWIWLSGGFRFFGRTTDEVKAHVDSTTAVNLYGNYYRQAVYYSFEYEEKDYHGKFLADQRHGIFGEGDYVKLKISVKDPNHAHPIARYRTVR